VSYIWSGPNGINNQPGQNLTINNVTLAASGTYFVKGTGINGCRNDASVNVIINPLPVAMINPGGPIALCAGGSVVLTSGSATGNLWSTGAVTQAITVNAAGSYSVTVSNNGCSSVQYTNWRNCIHYWPEQHTNQLEHNILCTGKEYCDRLCVCYKNSCHFTLQYTTYSIPCKRWRCVLRWWSGCFY
jgi:hypothetical protein